MTPFQRLVEWSKQGHRVWVIFAIPLLVPVVVRAGILPAGVVAAVVLVGAAILVAWLWPAIGAGILLYVAATTGSLLILLAAPVVVLLAAVGSGRAGFPRERLWAMKLALAALAAFVLTLPFIDWMLGDPEGGGAQSVEELVEQTNEGGGEPGWFARLLSRLFGRVGQGAELSPDAERGLVHPSPPDESSVNWWLFALIAGIVLLLALLLWWWLRRRRRVDEPAVEPEWALARLEGIGKALGRKRRGHEGPISYASELADLTGDRRLGTVGPLVSAGTYESPTADDQRTEVNLTGIESSMPPKPPKQRRPLKEIVRSRTTKRVLIGVAVAVILGGVIWFVATRVERFGDPEPSTAADAVLDELLATPISLLERWEACGVTAEGVPFSSVGLRTDNAAAVVRSMTFEEWSSAQRWALVDDEWLQITAYGDGYPEIWTEAVSVEPFLGDIFATFAGVGLAHGADPASARQVNDFTRYETAPDWMVDGTAPRRDWLVGMGHLFQTSWVLDVWVADGGPYRVRWMGDGPDGGWIEWRETWAVDGEHLGVECPDDPSRADGVEWLGTEPWERTIELEPRIAFDDDGNPFELHFWQDPGERGERLGEDLVSIDAQLRASTIYAMWDGDGEAVELPRLDGDDVVIARYGFFEYAELVMLELPGRTVDRWAAEPVDLYFDGSGPILIWGEFQPVDPDNADIVEWWEESLTWLDDTSLIVNASLSEIQLATGFDADGEVVAVVLSPTEYQWRLFDFGGDPPTQVVAREAELRECLAGARPIEADGTCAEG